MRSSSSKSAKSRTQWVRLSSFKGVNRYASPERIPDGYLADARNVRLSRGIAEPRVGLRKRYDVTTVMGADLPITGIGTWRFPADDDSPAVHHQLIFGQKEETADGNTSIVGALYSDTGLGLVDVTPMDGDKSLLTGAGLDAYFAELNYKTFMVNGRDGIVVYDGKRTLTDAAGAATALEEPLPPMLDKSFGSLRPATGWNWRLNKPVDHATQIIAATSLFLDYLHPSNGRTIQDDLVVTSDTGGAGEWVYHKFETPLDLTDPQYLSDYLETVYVCDVENFTPAQLYIGKINAADPTTDPESLSWRPGHLSSLFWNMPVATRAVANHARFPFNIDDPTTNAILSHVDYVAVKVAQGSNIGDLLGTAASTVSAHWHFEFHGLFAPGRLDGGITRYRTVYFDGDADANGPAGAVASVECYEGIIGESSDLPIKDLCRRVKITVDFTNAQTNVDQAKIYRAHHEPAENDLQTDSGQWYEVKEVLRTDADENNQVIVYDNLTEGELIGDALKVIPFDESPTAFNNEAPWYIASTGTRILYARTKQFPGRVWASEVAKGSAVPNISIDDYDLDETPHGGFADVGHDDGGTITGLINRMNDTVVFKDNDLVIWTRANENTPDERWQFTPISAPGCVSPRSICRIVDGIVYAGADGIYFLPDNSYQVVSVPLSEAARGYFEDVPQTLRTRIACEYDPVNRLLFVAMAEEGETRPSCLAVYDTTAREWQGKWAADEIGFQPGFLYVDYLPVTGQRIVFIADAEIGAVWTLRDPETDPTPYGDGDLAADVPCSVTTRYFELEGYKSKIVRRRLEFVHDEQSEDDDPLTVKNISLSIRSRPGGVKEFGDYSDTVSDPTVETNGLIEFGNSNDGLERLSDVQGLQHQATVAWSNDGSNLKPVKFLGLSLSLVPAGRYH